jgi:NADH-quinone oxidoreductase E subunit
MSQEAVGGAAAPVAFSEQAEQTLATIVARYPTRRAALLPVLYLAQEEFGYLSEQAMAYVAQRLDLPEGKVFQVATFYTMFHKKPAGTYHIEVCTSVPCCMMGGYAVVRHLEKRLGIRCGGVTPDRRFSLAQAECLAGCGHAPLMQINSVHYENLTEEEIDRILDGLP